MNPAAALLRRRVAGVALATRSKRSQFAIGTLHLLKSRSFCYTAKASNESHHPDTTKSCCDSKSHIHQAAAPRTEKKACCSGTSSTQSHDSTMHIASSEPTPNESQTIKTCCSKGNRVRVDDPKPAPEPNALSAEFWSDPATWRSASANTFRCLIGCSIGDFGMMFWLNAYFPGIDMVSMLLLSMTSGIATSVALETVILKRTQQMTWSQSFNTAVGMSMISMLTMEIVESLVDLSMYGGSMMLHDPLWWGALGLSMLAGFLSPLPYNYYRLRKYNKSCH